MTVLLIKFFTNVIGSKGLWGEHGDTISYLQRYKNNF